MAYSIPGSVAIVDADNDGFIDTAYIGDLGNNLWRFKFCLASGGSTCTTSNWSGGMAYESSTGELRPIYTTPSVSRDANGHVWIYWGTGDKTDPTAANAQEKFYALKDDTRTGTYHLSDLENITTGVYSDASKKGWYINLSGTGEKVIAEAAVFGGVVTYDLHAPAGRERLQSGGRCQALCRRLHAGFRNPRRRLAQHDARCRDCDGAGSVFQSRDKPARSVRDGKRRGRCGGEHRACQSRSPYRRQPYQHALLDGYQTEVTHTLLYHGLARKLLVEILVGGYPKPPVCMAVPTGKVTVGLPPCTPYHSTFDPHYRIYPERCNLSVWHKPCICISA
jgi:hypothetical protein